MFDALAVYRVDHELGRQPDALQHATGAQRDAVAQAVLHLQRRGRVFTVIHERPGLMHLLVQGAAKGHVHLLETPADAEYRHAGIHRCAQQRQGQMIACRIMRRARRAGRALIVLRFDVGRRAGEHQAIDVLQQAGNVDQLRHRRNRQRQAASADGGGAQVLVDHRVIGMQADLLAAGSNADQGLTGHGEHLAWQQKTEPAPEGSCVDFFRQPAIRCTKFPATTKGTGRVPAPGKRR